MPRRPGPQAPAGPGQARTALLGATLVAMLLALGLRRREAGAGVAVTPAGARDAGEAGRGREAEGPLQVPAAGWRDVFWRVVHAFSADRVLTEAAAVAFFALLAIFPAIAALVSLYGLFADPQAVERQVEALAGILPGGALEVLRGQMQRVAAGGRTELGLGFAMSLAVSLWSANQGTKALFTALNVVYGEEEKRGFIRFTLVTLAVTLGGLVFVLLALGAVVVLPVVLGFLGVPSWVERVLHLARWPILLIAVSLMLAVLYRFGPSRESARWQWLSWGGTLAATLWLVGSAAFSWYVENFGSYNETYGSLGAVVGFLVWIWLSAAVVLLGGEVNAELEHQTARDTTTGPAQPLGVRGARMADRVAARDRA
ncbi:YihY/virulence factor BrkB family protein [Caldovatus sediminis]|nr:YihY/virulence factor BrkB family protein [Caldovatus sediminis]